MKRIKSLLSAIMWATIDFCIVIGINISDRIKRAKECLFYRDYKNLLFYKIGFYFMSLFCACLFIAWIGTSVSRDNAVAINKAHESTITTYRILLQYSVRKTDILIDIYTAKDPAIWDIYCDQIRQFKIEHAKRHNHEN